MNSYNQLINQIKLCICSKKRFTYIKPSKFTILILNKLIELRLIDSIKILKNYQEKNINKRLLIFFKYKHYRNLILDIKNFKHYKGRYSLTWKKIKRLCNKYRNSIIIINTVWGVKAYSYRILKIQKENQQWLGGQPLFRISTFY